jgi:aminobenzoyl-glutamate utilization protein B
MRRILRIHLMVVLAIVSSISPSMAAGQAKKTDGATNVLNALDAKGAHYAGIASQIWGFAEVGYQEVKSSALLRHELATAGFKVDSGVNGMPTAFIASYGSGKPVIAIIGEFDALPGLSQDTVPDKKMLISGGPGHGCGHNLFGTASVAAAAAVKEWMMANKIAGTLRFYGTPAEEGGSGKVFMVRDGLFDDVDAVVTWHPSDHNAAGANSSLANVGAKFRFHGVSAHAAIAPEKGRSALDAVEAMDNMVNMMREHISSDARVHYVITDGGKAPNVVPDFAEVYYVARHNDMRVLDDIWERILNAARGAALGTGTTMDVDVISAVWNVLPNEYLARLQQKNLERVGGVSYSASDKVFGERLQKTLIGSVPPVAQAGTVSPFQSSTVSNNSTDLGDVSWRVPTAELSVATWVPGTPAHTWQAAAAAGMDIGAKGMMVAAKTMALTAIDLFSDPRHVAKARAEFDAKRGPSFIYHTRLEGRKPALDYRK